MTGALCILAGLAVLCASLYFLGRLKERTKNHDTRTELQEKLLALSVRPASDPDALRERMRRNEL